MNISVVVTFLRQSDSLVDCLESVLSQKTWPHQVVLAGPVWAESSVDLAEMYEPEVDDLLLFGDEHLTHTDLRRRVLPRLTGDQLIPLNACDYLYPGAIDAFRAEGNSPVTLGSYLHIAADGTEESLPGGKPDSLGEHLAQGPAPSGSLLINTSWLQGRDEWFWEQANGPLFSFAVVEAARREGTLSFVSRPVLEHWSYREGPVCWPGSVWEAFGVWLRERENRSAICPLWRSMAEPGCPSEAEQLLSRFCEEAYGPDISIASRWLQPPGPVLE